jgi:hypothetical protein
LIPKGNISLGANQTSTKIEWTWGVVNGDGTDGPNLAGTPSPFKPNPNVGAWQGTNIVGIAGQKYWVKAVFTWSDTANHVNTAVRGEVTLDP